MDKSILVSTKKLVGMQEEYIEFDTDIIIHTNTALAILNQMGIGVVGFTIDSVNQTWDDFLENETDKDLLKSFVPTWVGLKVKTLFDPPSGAAQTAVDESLKELEYRIYIINNLSGK